MAVVLNVSGDYAYFDGTQAVRLGSVDSYVAGTGGKKTEQVSYTSIATALKRSVTTREIGLSGGIIRTGDVKWNLSKTELGSVVPKVGDRVIEADGTTWRIMYVDRMTFDTRFRCYGRRP